MTTTRTPPRIPFTAARLRLPLWQRGQQRMRDRYGFDLNAPDALQRAEQLLAATPGDADMHLLRASVLATQGNNEEAEREVRQALQLNPESARAHTTLATLLVQRGEAAEGLQEARWAAEIDATDPTVLYNVGLAEWTAGSRSAAGKAFRAASEALNGPGRTPWWRRVFGHRAASAPEDGPPGNAGLTPSDSPSDDDGKDGHPHE
ncbi:MAG TPA: tetratricopeptide repeat protein [Candidatus Dormibacteraeota bacterium]|nr:tetratricopeptide repeat protein [Candidatus Dormibacteraeota bacterium]